MTKRKDVQIYRGVAVLAVVFFHGARSKFPNGYLGVDVFFVISGFLVIPLVLRVFAKQTANNLSGQMQINKDEIKLFFQRRFLRLFPSLNMGLQLSIVLSFFFIPLSLHGDIARQALCSLAASGNFGAEIFSGNYFQPEPNPLIHLWSLGVEEQFYILTPLSIVASILLTKFHKNNKKLTQILSILIFFVLAKLVDQIYLTIVGHEHAKDFAYYSTSSHSWQFLVGGFIAVRGLRSKSQSKLLQILPPLVLVALVSVLFFPLQLQSLYSQTAVSVLTVTVLAFNVSWNALGIFKKLLIWLGDRSYSIYIIHMPVFWIAKYSPVLSTNTMLLSSLKLLSGIVITLALGSWMYSSVEKPYRINRGNKGIYQTLIKRSFLPLAATILMLVALYGNSSLSFWQEKNGIQKSENLVKTNTQCESDAETKPSCRINSDNASNSILLIGDSHAHHLVTGMSIVAKNEGWNLVVWAQSACPFQLKSSIAVSDKCVSNDYAILDWVVRNRPKLIIVSQYVKENSTVDLLVDGLMELKKTKSNIVVIENSPVFPDQGKFQQEQSIFELMLNGKYVAPKTYPIEELVNINEPNNRKFSIAATGVGVRVVSLDSLFCNSTSCTRWSKSGWLYKDSNHFSIEGSRRAADLLQKQLLITNP